MKNAQGMTKNAPVLKFTSVMEGGNIKRMTKWVLNTLYCLTYTQLWDNVSLKLDKEKKKVKTILYVTKRKASGYLCTRT